MTRFFGKNSCSRRVRAASDAIRLANLCTYSSISKRRLPGNCHVQERNQEKVTLKDKSRKVSNKRMFLILRPGTFLPPGILRMFLTIHSIVSQEHSSDRIFLGLENLTKESYWLGTFHNKGFC